MAGLNTRTQQCVQCNASMYVHTLPQNPNATGDYWLVIRCQRCSGLNLLSLGPVVGGFGLDNCDFEVRLPTKEYTLEQALVKVEQMRQSGN